MQMLVVFHLAQSQMNIKCYKALIAQYLNLKIPSFLVSIERVYFLACLNFAWSD